MNAAHRIVVIETGPDLAERVVRERAPANDVGARLLAEMPWAGTGPLRGAWEDERRVEVEYVPPPRRAA